MKTLKEKLESGEVQEISLENQETLVIFYKDDQGIVHAVFPQQENGEYYGSYTHIGQHSDCSMEWISDLQLATEEDYQGLASELTDKVGYNLKVINQEIRDLENLWVRIDKSANAFVFLSTEHYKKGYRGFPGLDFATRWAIIKQEMVWF